MRLWLSPITVCKFKYQFDSKKCRDKLRGRSPPSRSPHRLPNAKSSLTKALHKSTIAPGPKSSDSESLSNPPPPPGPPSTCLQHRICNCLPHFNCILISAKQLSLLAIVDDLRVSCKVTASFHHQSPLSKINAACTGASAASKHADFCSGKQIILNARLSSDL
ncbi:hypothetical protein ACN38_g2324 [Penicillium nordicum]|uniref:Uncharacterized protein n=1 Tax=Penicillium nordicum TaxID=229535 RepID=A0A0M8PE38_9EURO|nr:hypothetical protein ACN38_g2324 [Penicillium nordicum]